ncbi:MAG TPA: FAD-dependent oxidoreductase [Desulfatiglandales bacterium]|nr:FAD-dependent oxidoreductase [Desulfatiglandales bacterium]
MAQSNLSKLFEPIEIGKISVRNRVLMPAMATCFATGDHFVTDQLISYYAKRAEGGVGLIIVEATCIDDPIGIALPHELCIDDDKYIPGLSKLADAVHSYGGKIAIQLHHAGPKSHFDGAEAPVAPSPLPLANKPHLISRALSKEEIAEIIKKFAHGAKRAKQAGFDAVELICAHGYLLNHFLSPHTNKRQDEYGGSLEGRMRILREIIENIKKEAGKDYPILCKVPGDDYVDGGITVKECITICGILENFGISALTITGGGYPEAKFNHIGPMGYPLGWQVHLAEKVKRNIKIPIVAMGKIKNPEFAETILKDGKADAVAMGRALIADPELVVKAQRNEIDRIIPCISCNHCRERIGDKGKTLRCAVNPLTGREYETRFVPATRPRKVLVVGGGPAGMQAAIVAASRGHEVILCEKSDKLGGQLLLAIMPPDKEEISPFLDYLYNQLSEKGIDIRLNTKATGQVVESIDPEVVIAATGSLPLIPPISGANLNIVVTAWDAFVHTEKVGNNVVIVGGGMVGCEVAQFLAERSKKVTIVEQLEDIGLDIEFASRTYKLSKLHKAKVTIMTKAPVKEITKEGPIVYKNGRVKKVVAADTVVLAVGTSSNRELLEELATDKREVYAIGDCVVPRKIAEATSQGFQIGCCL